MKKSIGLRIFVFLGILGVITLLISMCGIFALQGAEEDMRAIIEMYQSNPENHTAEMGDVIQVHAIDELQVMVTNRTVLTVLYIIFVVVTVSLAINVSYTVSRPSKSASKTIRGMVEKLERGEADLTERVAVKGVNEVAQMGRGINAFVEQLQKTVSEIQSQSLELDKTVAGMTNSVAKSNESAANVSGVMQELSARMQEDPQRLHRLPWVPRRFFLLRNLSKNRQSREMILWTR